MGIASLHIQLLFAPIHPLLVINDKISAEVHEWSTSTIMYVLVTAEQLSLPIDVRSAWWAAKFPRLLV